MPRAPRRRHSATVSRLKALLALTENFNRLNLTNAGSTSAKWKHVVSGWVIAAGKGTSTAIGALISTTFASTNATISAKNPAPGVGPAFWVTDSGNYWSVIHNVINVCQTCTACGSYNSCTYCNSYGTCPEASCNGYGTCNASVCTGGYSTCQTTACAGWGSCAASTCNSYQNVLVTVCTGGYSESPRTSCNSPYFYTVTVCNSYGYSYKLGYGCIGWTDEPRTGCMSYYTYYVTSCNGYYEYYAFQCTSTYDYFITCCTGGYYQAFYTCCPGGFYDYTYTCCTGGFYSYTVSCCTGYATGVSAACGCAGYYTYNCNCADNHRIDLIKKEGGSETVVASTSNSTTNIAGIKVITSGDNITVSAYSDTGLSSQVGSNISTTHSGQKSKEHGIISRASSSSQGYTIDEFRVNE